ncbi:tetratricopeptide repeat protein [Candidatus Thiosymbion oneisti]|uniref:tetratricopeptide repeat protein n=1 Tax=Candidatus Thiosymbion oneisti TaxID=589554 RepID=UPI000B1E4369|nr:tetratricopeptide repeat protein [Candidatus Thiosymbion oneisti]
MKIISFFSFKGGVGRTALLTNLGAYWAGRGKVVVLMDLDLMAPGLAYSPLAGPYLYPEGKDLGMSDLIAALQPVIEEPDREEAAQGVFLPPHWLLREMHLSHQDGGPGKDQDQGQLLLIDAGSHPVTGAPPGSDGILAPIPPRRGTPDESDRQTLYRSLAYQMREDLEHWRVPEPYPAAGRTIDYLLIDSRTGFAELPDLSLGYLADRIVLVAGLNPQNLKGLELTLRALLASNERIPIDELHRQLCVVFSPIPTAEDETVFAALEEAHSLLNQSRRIAANREYERVPESFVLHYTPILATSELPLATRWPESLYGREVLRIAHHLEGKTGREDQDQTLRRIRDQILQITAPAEQTPETTPVSPPMGHRPNPLTNLPAWHWPLGEPDEPARMKRLDELLPADSAITTDREYFLNRLANSLVLTAEEKQDILQSYPSLSPDRVDEFLTIFKEEQKGFESLLEQFPDGVFDPFHQRVPEWGGIVLGDENAGWRRYLYAPLKGESLFAHAEAWPHYWLGLARELIARMGDREAADQAIERAEAVADPSELETLAEQLLELELPETTPAEIWNQLEERARRLAPGHAWLDFLIARRLLQAPEPDLARAEQLLTHLLDHPPDDSFRCFLMVTLVIGELPRLAIRTEPILRQAIALDLKDALPWHNLGNLLTEHLNRYEEAEAVYRQAIELNPKFAHPWNGLGDLLMQYPDRYEEAEAAYRQAIELDPKFAFSWNGLGLLHQTLHRDCEEAFRCFTEGLTRSKPESLEAAHLQLNLGRLELVRGRPDRARKALEQALDLFDRQPRFQANALWLAVGLAGPTDPESGPRLVSKTDHSAEESIATLVERHTRLAREALERDPKSAAARYLFIASLATGEADEALWQEILSRLETHQACFGFINDLYLFAGLRPDTAPAAAQRVAALLALPAEQVARFRDRPKPPDWLERYRPFAEGRSRGAGDPADRTRFCL